MKSNDWRHKNVARYTPGNTKILYFFNCLLDGMHTIGSLPGRLSLNELNIKSVYLIATRDLSNLWLQFFLSQNQGFMRLFEKTVLK